MKNTSKFLFEWRIPFAFLICLVLITNSYGQNELNKYNKEHDKKLNKEEYKMVLIEEFDRLFDSKGKSKKDSLKRVDSLKGKSPKYGLQIVKNDLFASNELMLLSPPTYEDDGDRIVCLLNKFAQNSISRESKLDNWTTGLGITTGLAGTAVGLLSKSSVLKVIGFGVTGIQAVVTILQNQKDMAFLTALNNTMRQWVGSGRTQTDYDNLTKAIRDPGGLIDSYPKKIAFSIFSQTCP